MTERSKPVLQVLKGQTPNRIPFWMMRQAGRYLPEYREVREKAGGFLDLAFNPDLAAEVTLQPLRRFNMDAAILFSDILTVPLGLGQHVEFVPGKGPVLEPIRDKTALDELRLEESFDKTLGPVYETVSQIRTGLAQEGFDETALIGFAGAPWTVACYMVEGGGSKSFAHVKGWSYRDPKTFSRLIDLLVEGTTRYLSNQIKAGAEVIQLFDSWASVLDEGSFRQWSIAPTRQIVSALKEKYPDTPIIGFPRGTGVLYPEYIRETGIDAVGIDYQLPLDWVAETIQPLVPVQGNLDPMCLLGGGAVMDKRIKNILATLGKKPFIFNLGHGIHKTTPPEHVSLMAEIIRGFEI